MKLNLISKTTLFVSVLMMFSCGKKQTSSITGWAYNDKKTGGFEVLTDYHQKTPPGMVFIEGGTFTMGRTQEDIPGDWNNIPRRVTVSSFYMDQCEISNLNWREYLHWTQLVMHNFPDLIKKATPDSTVWRKELGYNEPLVEYYFTHVAYNNYPVVGVTWEQASDFSTWRTDRANELALAQSGTSVLPDFEGIKDNEDHEEIRNNQVFNTRKYLLSPDYNPEAGKKPKQDLFGNDRKVNNSDGVFYPDFRLPTEAEWEYAAYAILAKNGEENSGEKKQFPWQGHQMRNPAKKYRGEMQANYARGRGDYMGMGGKLNDRATVTNTVDSYWPNEFGLYNMAGNVNEWVMDVYRPLTGEVEEEYNSFRGNEWKAPTFTSNTVTGETIKIPVLDSLGRVSYVYPDKDSTMTAYLKADVRNYLDGDARSSLNKADWTAAIDPEVSTKKLYDADNNPLDARYTDKTRVYKGGSWRDRPYWLNPSTRRYLEQDKCRDDLGFRCVVSKVGSDDTRFR